MKQGGGAFAKEPNEKFMLQTLLELVVKSNSLLDLIKPGEGMKIMELSVNKQEIMLEKSKLLILKLDDLFMVLPLTLNKIEVKTRNILVNEQSSLEGLSRFLKFYLEYADAGVPKEDNNFSDSIREVE